MARRIQRLPDDLVRHIAAGEVIHGPDQALKELIENSLDANATSIEVRVRNAGLHTLIVKDNGTGIEQSDTPSLFQRHSTSKIRCKDDLCRGKLRYGFRGEAIASIAEVASVTMRTKTKNAVDGYMVTNDDRNPKVCATNAGTTVEVANLFHRQQPRRAQIQATNMVTNMVELIRKYSIHHYEVAFSLHVDGKLRIRAHADHSRQTRVKHVMERGQLDGELHEAHSPQTSTDFQAVILFGQMTKRSRNIHYIFVNDRPVENDKLHNVFRGLSSQATFNYVSIVVETSQVEVNYHPTKDKVMILGEDQVAVLLQTMINAENHRRQQQQIVTVRSREPGLPRDRDARGPAANRIAGNSRHDSTSRRRVATGDRNGRKLKKARWRQNNPDMAQVAHPSRPDHTLATHEGHNVEREQSSDTITGMIQRLRGRIDLNMHDDLCKMLQDAEFRSVIDFKRRHAEIWSQGSRWRVNYGKMANDLFTQLLVTRSDESRAPQSCSRFDLEQHLSRADKALLWSTKHLLDSLLGVNITDDNGQISIPRLVEGIEPDPGILAEGLRGIAHDIQNHTSPLPVEQHIEAFASVYAPVSLPNQIYGQTADASESQRHRVVDNLQTRIFPAVRGHLRASQLMAAETTKMVEPDSGTHAHLNESLQSQPPAL